MYSSMLIYPLLSEAKLILAQLLLDACQKSYAYRPFTLPNCHFIKQILLISQRKGDKNSQPRKQSKDILNRPKIQNQRHLVNY